MGSTKVKMSKAGAQSVLKSGGVRADLLSRAQSIASSACVKTGADNLSLDPFIAKVEVGSVTAKARVIAATPHGQRASNKNAVLLKSIDSGR